METKNIKKGKTRIFSDRVVVSLRLDRVRHDQLLKLCVSRQIPVNTYVLSLVEAEFHSASIGVALGVPEMERGDSLVRRVTVSLRMSQDVREEINKRAKHLECSTSDYLIHLIDLDVKKSRQ